MAGKTAVKGEIVDEHQELVNKAHHIDKKIREGVSATRTAMIMLGGFFHDAFEQRVWELLGYEDRKEWLASPGIELRESSAQAVAQVWRETVVERELEPGKLQGIDVRKVQIVLPAVRDGRAELEPALDDCRELGRRDLAIKYAQDDPDAPLDAETEPEMGRCPACGRWTKISDIKEDE